MSVNKTKKINLIVDDKEVEVTIRKLNAGEKNDIMRMASKGMRMVGSKMEGMPDIYTIQEQTILKGIVQAPFKFDLDGIRSLDIQPYNELFTQIDSYCGVTPEKKEDGSGVSNTEPETEKSKSG
jgi:hypothetical protein